MVITAIASPSQASEPLVSQDSSESGKCLKCPDLLSTIGNLETQLEEEQLQKENLKECLNNTFAMLTEEFDSSGAKDDEIRELKEKLQDATAQLDSLTNEQSIKELSKTKEDYVKEVLKGKESLRTELDKVKEVRNGRTCSRAVQDLPSQLEAAVAENWELASALELANHTIFKLEDQLQNSIASLETAPNAITTKDANSKKSIELEVDNQHHSPSSQQLDDSSQKSLVEDVKVKEEATHEQGKLAEEIRELENQLRKSQNANALLKQARGNANRILHDNLRSTHHQLHYVTQQNNLLVSELGWDRDRFLCKEQECACLRNQLNFMAMEMERLGILLAQTNRRSSEMRDFEVAKLREKMDEKMDDFEKLQRKNDKYIDKIEKLTERNHQLEKLLQQFTVAHNSAEAKSPLHQDCSTTPEPKSPRTPSTPYTPIHEEPSARQMKRRSDENECGINKKQKQ